MQTMAISSFVCGSVQPHESETSAVEPISAIGTNESISMPEHEYCPDLPFAHFWSDWKARAMGLPILFASMRITSLCSIILSLLMREFASPCGTTGLSETRLCPGRYSG